MCVAVELYILQAAISVIAAITVIAACRDPLQIYSGL
jgi:hypothetical protein